VLKQKMASERNLKPIEIARIVLTADEVFRNE